MKNIRISTSPPSNHEFDADHESSYYCDLHQAETWLELEIISSNKSIEIFPGLDKVEAVFITTQYLFDERHKEIGDIFQYMSEDEELMYYGIDHAGNGRIEPAVNEAAWHIANAGEPLPDNHRLTRISTTKRAW